MSGAHTPGPWSVWPSYDGAFQIETGLYGTKRTNELVICSRAALGHRAPESLANARLISAAPELLKALEHLAELFADLAPLGEQTTREVALVNARAAILKATGTTPNIKSEG